MFAASSMQLLCCSWGCKRQDTFRTRRAHARTYATPHMLKPKFLCTRPICKLRIRKLRTVDSRFLRSTLWTWEFHTLKSVESNPLKSRFLVHELTVLVRYMFPPISAPGGTRTYLQVRGVRSRWARARRVRRLANRSFDSTLTDSNYQLRFVRTP